MIKRMGKSDLELVTKMLNELGNPLSSLGNITDFLDNKSNYFLAYLIDGEIVGYLIAYVLQRYDGRNEMLYLHEIDIKETYRRQGIATKLLKEIEGIRKSEGFIKMFLITNKSNDAAVKLYDSMNGINTSDDNIVYVFK